MQTTKTYGVGLDKANELAERIQKMLFDLGHARVFVFRDKAGYPDHFIYMDRTPGKLTCKKVKTFNQCIELLRKNIEDVKVRITTTIVDGKMLDINIKPIRDFDNRAVEVECFRDSYLLKPLEV